MIEYSVWFSYQNGGYNVPALSVEEAALWYVQWRPPVVYDATTVRVHVRAPNGVENVVTVRVEQRLHFEVVR